MEELRRTARNFGLGKAILYLYHRPFGLLRQSINEGGPLEQRLTRLGRDEMLAAAACLPQLPEPAPGPPAEVAFLSGPGFWHQTVFCFVSLQLVCPFRITPVIFDDGGLSDRIRAQIRIVVPWVRFVDLGEIESNLDRILPAKRFRALRARRMNYLHLRKLTDIHVAATGYTLVLDSDMLFYRRPTELLNWFAAPRPLYMQDVTTAYGYPSQLLEQLAGGPVPERVNVGLYGLDSASLDWDRLERSCGVQIERYGPNYLQEQALTAMAFVGTHSTPLPRSDYVVMPDIEEGCNPTAILHHYVAHSKRSYFQHGWRRIAALVPSNFPDEDRTGQLTGGIRSSRAIAGPQVAS